MAERRERCACGGVVVVLGEPSDFRIARAVAAHRLTPSHFRWRAMGTRQCLGVGGSMCIVSIPNDGRGLCHFCRRTEEMLARMGPSDV